jgi:hypothetical protein
MYLLRARGYALPVFCTFVGMRGVTDIFIKWILDQYLKNGRARKSMEVIVVNHGSRWRDFNELMEEFTTRLERDLGVSMRVGYNEWNPTGATSCATARGLWSPRWHFWDMGDHIYRDILGELGVEVGNASTALLAVVKYCRGGELPFVVASLVGFTNVATTRDTLRGGAGRHRGAGRRGGY